MNDRNLMPEIDALRGCVGCVAVMFWAVLLCAAISLLFSCASHKEVEQTVYIHDTVHVSKVDTVQMHHAITVRDTVHTAEQHFVTVNEAGDTLHTDHKYYYYHTVYNVDSSSLFRARIDSLQKLVHAYQSKTVVRRTKKPPWLAFLVCAFFLIALIRFIIRHFS